MKKKSSTITKTKTTEETLKKTSYYIPVLLHLLYKITNIPLQCNLQCRVQLSLICMISPSFTYIYYIFNPNVSIYRRNKLQTQMQKKLIVLNAKSQHSVSSKLSLHTIIRIKSGYCMSSCQGRVGQYHPCRLGDRDQGHNLASRLQVSTGHLCPKSLLPCVRL